MEASTVPVKRKKNSEGRKYDSFYTKKKVRGTKGAKETFPWIDENGLAYHVSREILELLNDIDPCWMNGQKTEPVTGLKFIIAKQPDSVPGMLFSDRGLGIQMKSAVPVPNSLVLLSRRGIVVTNEVSILLRRQGFFALNKMVIPRCCPTMMINCCNQIDTFRKEKSNVKLLVLTSKQLENRFNIHVVTGTYVAVINTTPLIEDDWLLVSHYGKWSKMPYGKPHYLRLQKLCIQKYQQSCASKQQNDYVCQKCLEKIRRNFVITTMTSTPHNTT